MEVRRTVKNEVCRVLFISGAAAVGILIALKAAGYLNPARVCGIASGYVCGAANFGMLAAAVMKIGNGTDQNPNTAARAIKRSYALRMGFMAAFSLAAIMLLKADPLMHALMLALPGFAARIGHR